MLGSRFELRLPDWMKTEIDRYAKNSKQTRSTFIRLAVIDYLKKQPLTLKTPKA